MEKAGRAANRTFSTWGFGIRRELKRIYGTPQEAEAAIREAMKDREALEMWAGMVTAKRHRYEALSGGFVDEYGAEFSFDSLMPAVREVAVQSIAAAMLVWTAEQERRAS